jgi:Flp pilus assembly pilin Flp
VGAPPLLSKAMSQAERNRVSRAVRRGEDGAAAVEFALVLPVLLALVMAIIDFGWLYFVENQISYAVRSVSRDVSVGTIANDLPTIKSEVQNRLSNLPFSVPDPTVCPPFDAACPSTGANEISIVVSVPMADAALINFLGLFSSGSIDVAVTMSLEP